MAYISSPKQTEGGVRKLRVSDDDVEQILLDVFTELRMIRVMMAKLTDSTDMTSDDVIDIC